ncbi:unnamed protein product [Cylicocyclus nassatus]|uniref:Uncharacterized protein n=1 Tax=Cylicocyclus nassatus TaxID=53992 RepID=A0AA36MDU8_CYLNA|nr:unnamed protein product [Cylicocyclus nassatus]
MQVFYVHLPWEINETEYNCSIRSQSEWRSRGSVNPYQGVYFMTAGTILAVLYVLSLFGMYRKRLLRAPCYKLMFFNGFIDLSELFVISYITAYFHFTGAVFCSNITLGWFAAHIGFCLWCGATFSCIVLALNRIVEMTDLAHPFRFLFQGKILYMWMFMSLLLIFGSAFLLRPIPFNSAVSAYISDPLIVDEPEIKKRYDYNTSLLMIVYDIVESGVLGALYAILCYIVWKKWNAVHSSDKFQKQLLIQVILICLPTILTGLLYGAAELFVVPRNVLIAINVMWQLSHGLHGVVYLCYNTRIRAEVVAMFVARRKAAPICNFPVIKNRCRFQISTF